MICIGVPLCGAWANAAQATKPASEQNNNDFAWITYLLTVLTASALPGSTGLFSFLWDQELRGGPRGRSSERYASVKDDSCCRARRATLGSGKAIEVAGVRNCVRSSEIASNGSCATRARQADAGRSLQSLRKSATRPS